MDAGKMPSQMNPLAQSDFKAMLAEFRSMEIQASVVAGVPTVQIIGFVLPK